MLCLCNSVFHSLADRELDSCLRRDLDDCSRSRVTSFASLASGLFQFAESRQREFAVLL